MFLCFSKARCFTKTTTNSKNIDFKTSEIVRLFICLVKMLSFKVKIEFIVPTR